jgi:hypothetical protein
VATGRLVSIPALASAVADSSTSNLGDVVNGDIANTVLTTVTSTSLGGSINVAQAVTRAVGVQAQLGIAFPGTSRQPYDVRAHGTTDARSSSTVPSLALALDFGAAPHLPVSGMLEYQIAFPRTKDEGGTTSSHTQHVIALGVYYSARKDLQLGIVPSAQLALEPVSGTAATRGAYAPSDRPSIFALEALARYVW